MARSIRIEYAGAFYHVMARGNRREAIFLDDDDRRMFLGSVGEDGLAGARLGADGQPLPSRGGDAGGESGGGNAVVLHVALFTGNRV